MHGSCTCWDSHAEFVRLMMTVARIGLRGTSALAAKTGAAGKANQRAVARTVWIEFMRCGVWRQAGFGKRVRPLVWRREKEEGRKAATFRRLPQASENLPKVKLQSPTSKLQRSTNIQDSNTEGDGDHEFLRC